MSVPVEEALRRLLSHDDGDFYRSVVSRFAATYLQRDVCVVRAPGRVNIIGEHTDYNGLAVMPMAIDREIAIALAPSSGQRIEMCNINASHPAFAFELSRQIERAEPGHWSNYARAAGQALWGWAEECSPQSLPLRGFVGCAGGTIPPGSGLSSSSALVVAAACALVEVNRLPIEASDLADLLARGERYVGTQGGGMDQAASILAREGAALKIDFFPLRTRPVLLPVDCMLIVASSMVEAHKAGEARLAYNSRVAECRLGLEMLKHLAGAPAADATLLRDIFALPDWPRLIGSLPEDPSTVAEIAALTGTDAGDLARQCLAQRDGSLLPEPAQGFEPKKRCRHVLTESDRVEQAAEASARGDGALLGSLMNESHASCAADYEISCEELDTLVESLRNAGALGARLTGAGFGGCAVALVETHRAPAIIDAVWADYYQGYCARRGIRRPDDRTTVLFACSPSAGAGVLDLENQAVG